MFESINRLLLEDKLIIFPTETVYGLGANAYSDAAVKNIYAAKNRPAGNPLIIHTYSTEKLQDIVKIDSKRVEERLQKLSPLWPGPLSLILKKNPRISGYATAQKDSVAVRIPAHKTGLEMLQAARVPVAAPSANLANYVSPTRVSHLAPELREKAALILDGGECSVGIESTVVNLLDDQVKILRPGSILLEELQDLLGERVVFAGTTIRDSETSSLTDPQLSPGQSSRHYSPKTPLFFLGTAGKLPHPRSVIICITEAVGDKYRQSGFNVVRLTLNNNLYEVARNLFSTLIELDKINNTGNLYDYILIEPCAEYGIGLAIMDRLKRGVTVIGN